MNPLFQIGVLVLQIFLYTGCIGQTGGNKAKQPKYNIQTSPRVGGDCEEGYCELMYLGMPDKLSATDTSAGWYEAGQKLIVTGTIFHLDGKTPAANVIVYYHHTDNNGYYSRGNDKPENQTRHGHIRGWVKTGVDGKYTIHTIRPAPYPDLSQPAHIHWLIKEPDVPNEYWTDDLVFDDDKLLLPFIKKNKPGNLGGSGIVRILVKDSIQIAEHNFILGLNITNYPKPKLEPEIRSGLSIGEDQPSFGPFHVFGPDKGSTACPVCKYGRYHGILFFAGDKIDWKEIKQWLVFMEQEGVHRSKYLKVYFVFGNTNGNSNSELQVVLENIGRELGLEKTALTLVPSYSDQKRDALLNKINPLAENTIIIYRHRTIIDKYINLKPTANNFQQIQQTLDQTSGANFTLPEIMHHD